MIKRYSPSKTGLLITVLFILFSFNVNAQIVSGIIYDGNKKPLTDVEIVNQQNNFVTVSNVDGSFTIKGNKKDELKFIYPGESVKIAVVDNVKNLKVYFDDAETIRKKQEKIREEEDRRWEKEKRKSDRKYRTKKEKVSRIITADHSLRGNPLKKTVIGQITDESGPLPGATIIIKGTKIAATTDFDGYYGIDAKIGDVLVISYIGMKTVEVKVDNRIMNVVLYSDVVMLESVVTTAVGSRKDRVAGLKVERSVSSIAEEVAAAPISDKKIAVTGKNNSIKAGQLTAGEVNDFSYYSYWKGLTETELNQWKNHWKLNPVYRYSVSLKNDKGFPVINKTVYLKYEKEIVWTARTDNTGRAELWFQPNDLSVEKTSDNLQIIDVDKLVLVSKPKEFHDGINTYTYKQDCVEQNKINIAFVIDATGSMGDEISYLQAELYDVIERTKKEFPGSDLSMGSVFYRDAGDEYLVKNFDFTTNIKNVISFIKKQNANGGGDYPEAVIEALEASIENMSWDDDARSKLLFLLLDAPPHYSDANVVKLQNLAKKAAEKGIRIIPIAASGIDKSTEYLMRAIALETNGTYLFITNHSGIGNDHIEPSAENYKVEMLNDLILRVIIQNCSVNTCDSKESSYSQNTEIEEKLTKKDAIDFKYYPNPTKDIVTVTLNKEAEELYLFDTTGKLILYKTDKSKEYKLDLAFLPNAVYYLKVLVDKREVFGKIIKQN
ncbi:carboxypeptidase-like regulatory domain-containing protein [Flavobacterium ajazii]|uniref:carboxypeptidase-like regulatory domain-containing protein n=1 Tax=Flavobacterium ajazii TaxID=2692318 RepID=UPI0013D04BED|nr:carboxypeptidase-like regulatory domain-containing protein [Flavobacterium ajazii]